MRISVFMATTLDGFIARSDGSLDWLEHEAGGEDYGYANFFQSVDLLVLGRKTFETVLGFGSWPYEEKETLVLSRTLRKKDLPPWVRDRVSIAAGTPAELAGEWRRQGRKRIYLDGGSTIRDFLRESLVTDLTLTRIPVLIGEGIPLFGSLPGDIRWKLVENLSFSSGLTQTRYMKES